jgi:hypothetical protein
MLVMHGTHRTKLPTTDLKIFENVVCGLFILWGLAIHTTFLASVRDPIFAPDSAGYVLSPLRYFFNQPLDFNPHRTPGYPIFLGLTLSMTRSFLGVLVVQHVLTLLMGACAALISYFHFRSSRSLAGAVFFCASSFPLPALYAHYILTEALYTFLLLGLVGLVLFTAAKSDWRRWLLYGLGLGVLILVRPSGLGLFPLLLAAWWLTPPKKKAWKSFLAVVFGMAFVLIPVALYNSRHHGFFGLDVMGGTALFCTTAGYLDIEKVQDARVREALAPFYKHHPDKMLKGDWVYSSPGSPFLTLHGMYPQAERNRICLSLGLQAIRQHPVRFLIDRLKLLGTFFLRDGEVPLFYRIPEVVNHFVYLGLDHFAQIGAKIPDAWLLLKNTPQNGAEYFKKLHFMKPERPERSVPAIPQSEVSLAYHYDRVSQLWTPIHRIFDFMRLLPALAILCGFYLIRQKETRKPALLIFAALFGQVLINTLAAWHDSRFAAPVLPLLFILLAGGVQKGWSTLKIR